MTMNRRDLLRASGAFLLEGPHVIRRGSSPLGAPLQSRSNRIRARAPARGAAEESAPPRDGQWATAPCGTRLGLARASKRGHRASRWSARSMASPRPRSSRRRSSRRCVAPATAGWPSSCPDRRARTSRPRRDATDSRGFSISSRAPDQLGARCISVRKREFLGGGRRGGAEE